MLPLKNRGLIASFVGLFVITVAYTNCQKGLEEGAVKQSSTRSTTTTLPNIPDNCVLAAVNLRNPKTIDETLDLVNALPKPLTLNCFLKNLPKPMQVFATNSKNSFQPAVDNDTPRIFIFGQSIVFSVVPGGAPKEALEISQVVTPVLSVKAEIYFPVLATLANDEPYKRVALAGVTGTSCQLCHRFESPAVIGFRGPAFASEIIAPLSQTRITATRMKYLSTVCGSSADQFRCNMLKTIFDEGSAVDAAWPF